MRADHSSEDLQRLVRTICNLTDEAGFMRSSRVNALPLAFTHANPHPPSDAEDPMLPSRQQLESAGGRQLADAHAADRRAHEDSVPNATGARARSTLRVRSRVVAACFGANKTLGQMMSASEGTHRPGSRGTAASQHRTAEGGLPVLIGVHVANLGNSNLTKRVVAGIWRSMCAACGLRCALAELHRADNASVPTAKLPAGVDLGIVALSAHHVPDLEGIAFEGASAETGPGAPTYGMLPISWVGRFLHVVVDLSGELSDALRTEEEAVSTTASGKTSSRAIAPVRRSLMATKSASDDGSNARARYPILAHPGIMATRMLLRARAIHAKGSVLGLPPLTRMCQDHSIWRTAFRFVGVQNEALSHIWRQLAVDWPAFFRCN